MKIYGEVVIGALDGLALGVRPEVNDAVYFPITKVGQNKTDTFRAV
jgi:hypothetical protein